MMIIIGLLLVILLSPVAHTADARCKAMDYKTLQRELIQKADGYFVYVRRSWYTLPLEHKEMFALYMAKCHSDGGIRILDGYTGKLLARWGSNGYVNYEN
jgi:hypothetical protein